MITHNGKSASFWLNAKRIGTTVLASTDPALAPLGSMLFGSGTGASAVGTGAPQSVRGSAPIQLGTSFTTAQMTEVLGATGSSTDALTYTLTF